MKRFTRWFNGRNRNRIFAKFKRIVDYLKFLLGRFSFFKQVRTTPKPRHRTLLYPARLSTKNIATLDGIDDRCDVDRFRRNATPRETRKCVQEIRRKRTIINARSWSRLEPAAIKNSRNRTRMYFRRLPALCHTVLFRFLSFLAAVSAREENRRAWTSRE